MSTLTVGLTGGIGSGKSAASALFESLGIDVVDADIIAREVVAPGTKGLADIVEHFGEQLLQADGSLDRAALRHLIFNDPAHKQWLERCLHPIIRDETIAQLKGCRSTYRILVSPLLFETNQHELVDRTLLIDAEESIQIERASARDSVSAEQIKRIISQQSDRGYKRDRADDIIDNNAGFDELKALVETQHRLYLDLARECQ